MTNTKSKKKLYLMIVAGIAGLIILSSILTPYKTINIPNSVYDAAKEKPYYDNLLQNEKKIFWVGATNCPIAKKRKYYINKIINALSYEEFYTQVPLLISSLSTANSAEIFFLNNCGNNICIVIPQRQIILKIKREKDIVKILKKVKDW